VFLNSFTLSCQKRCHDACSALVVSQGSSNQSPESGGRVEYRKITFLSMKRFSSTHSDVDCRENKPMEISGKSNEELVVVGGKLFYGNMADVSVQQALVSSISLLVLLYRALFYSLFITSS
jgi:hypothetical protein